MAVTGEEMRGDQEKENTGEMGLAPGLDAAELCLLRLSVAP